MVLPPPIALTRTAIRAALAALPPDQPVIVACSGGADSVALAAATAFVCAREGRRAGLVTIDHRLQAGSAERAAAVVALGAQLGLAPSRAVAVDVGSPSSSGPAGRSTGGGPEAAARDARHGALDAAAVQLFDEPAAVLLGHTLDDQAETVLLGLGRGAGGRSIAGMRPDRPAEVLIADGGSLARDGRFAPDGAGAPDAAGAAGAARRLRPFLGLRRADTRAACVAAGLPIWDDPHNEDPRFRRVRVRHEALPVLEDVLGGGVAGALARTAAHLQEDGDALDALAAHLLMERIEADGALALEGPGGAELAAQPRALRTRVVRAWLRGAGQAPLTHAHVDDLDRLITRWHGQRAICLPGGAEVVRRSGRLHVQTPQG